MRGVVANTTISINSYDENVIIVFQILLQYAKDTGEYFEVSGDEAAIREVQ